MPLACRVIFYYYASGHGHLISTLLTGQPKQTSSCVLFMAAFQSFACSYFGSRFGTLQILSCRFPNLQTEQQHLTLALKLHVFTVQAGPRHYSESISNILFCTGRDFFWDLFLRKEEMSLKISAESLFDLHMMLETCDAPTTQHLL